MLKSNKHSSLHSSELEKICVKTNDMVKNTHLPNKCAHSVFSVQRQRPSWTRKAATDCLQTTRSVPSTVPPPEKQSAASLLPSNPG